MIHWTTGRGVCSTGPANSNSISLNLIEFSVDLVNQLLDDKSLLLFYACLILLKSSILDPPCSGEQRWLSKLVNIYNSCWLKLLHIIKMYWICNKYVILVAGKNPSNWWSSQMISIFHVLNYPGCTFKQVLAGMVATLSLSFYSLKIYLQNHFYACQKWCFNTHSCDIISIYLEQQIMVLLYFVSHYCCVCCWWLLLYINYKSMTQIKYLRS